MMARRKAPSIASKRPRKREDLLGTLKPEEAQGVLHRLLAANPDLRREAERFARSVLAMLSFEAVAQEVEEAVRALDLDALHGRAGRHAWGYVEPTEAAWELLEEALDPFLDEMKRHIRDGREREALEVCKGILLGLYRLRDEKSSEFLGWAPDFPEEAASWAVDTWRAGRRKGRARGRGSRKPALFPQDFVDRFVPEWGWLKVANRARG